MKFQQEVTVTGIKRSKGEFEGKAYDSTKFYFQVDLDDKGKGDAKGTATSEYSFGDSKEFDKYSHLPYPFRAMADLEITTSGKSDKIVLRALKPLEMVKKAA